MAQRRSRLDLHRVLESIAGEDNVYYQPKTNTVMTYPAVIYTRDGGESEHADNGLYRFTQRYQVTHIYRDPDDIEISDKILELPMCTEERTYPADDLYHDVFNIYF